jgi:hypothetical protein
MRVLGPYVLIEQVKRKKHSGIIITKKNQIEWDEFLKVLSLGPGIPNPEFQVGESPILSRNVVFQGVKVITMTPDEEIVHFIVHHEDIVGIEDPVVEPSTNL